MLQVSVNLPSDPSYVAQCKKLMCTWTKFNYFLKFKFNTFLSNTTSLSMKLLLLVQLIYKTYAEGKISGVEPILPVNPYYYVRTTMQNDNGFVTLTFCIWHTWNDYKRRVKHINNKFYL